jgi:hypothetical protein
MGKTVALTLIEKLGLERGCLIVVIDFDREVGLRA